MFEGIKRSILVVILLFIMPCAMADYNSYPKITQMEKQLYKQSFESQDIYQRLARIETSLYKSVQSNRSLAERVDTIANRMHISSMPGYLLNEIERLEVKSFNKSFRNDSPDNRIERLEYHLAGALLEGNYEDRVYKLKTLASKNSIDDYFGNESSNYSMQSNSGYSQEEPNGWQKTLMFLAPIIMGIL